MTKREFVYPPKDIIAKSRATTTSFTNPIIRLVFWERYKKAFSYLVSLQRTFDVVLEIGTSYGFCLPCLGSILKKGYRNRYQENLRLLLPSYSQIDAERDA